MRNDQYSEFVKIINRAAVLTYKPKDTDFGELKLALFEELAKYELEDVRVAVAAHVRVEKFFPMLADIVRRIDGTPEEHAALAWTKVVDAVRHIGRCNSVAFPAPAYNYALSQMGEWIGLCASLRDDEVKWRGKDFAQIFINGGQRASWDDVPGRIRVERYCVGMFEIHNRAHGFLSELPDVIDAETRRPIIGFRDALPAPGNPGNNVIPMVGALVAARAARMALL